MTGAASIARGIPAVLLLALLAGCSTAPKTPEPITLSRRNGEPVQTPVVAVTDFENRGNINGNWNIGAGMADLLEAELLRSGKVIVLERKNLSDVLGEISRQGSQMFRPEGRAKVGRLKNAQYLIRGIITDFTITRGSSAWVRFKSLFLSGGGHEARVALNLHIVDVENGEILASVKAAGTCSAGSASAAAKYEGVAFGGDTFFRTPLGQATEDAIREALKRIFLAIPERPWVPLVAEATPKGDVIINGGANARLQPGDWFVVRGEPRLVTDPLTGNEIERQAGPVIGRLCVTEVLAASSHARLDAGIARRGDLLEKVTPSPQAGRSP